MLRTDKASPHIKALIAHRLRSRASKRLPKPAIPKHPKQIEIFYFQQLQQVLHAMKHVVTEIIFPELGSILRKAEASRPKKDLLHEDAYSEDIKHAVKKGLIQFEKIVPVSHYKKIADKVAEKTNGFNQQDNNRVFKSVLGIDVFKHEPWLKQEMTGFTEQNVSYIKSIPEDYFDRIEHTVFRGVRSGASTKSIAADLQHDYNVSERKAAFIARDQIGKFNGSLNMLRQKDIGVEKFVWQTSEDERVRPSHAELDGLTFAWDDPPVTDDEGGTNIPGEDFNCRCVGIPVFESSEEIEGTEEEVTQEEEPAEEEVVQEEDPPEEDQ